MFPRPATNFITCEIFPSFWIFLSFFALLYRSMITFWCILPISIGTVSDMLWDWLNRANSVWKVEDASSYYSIESTLSAIRAASSNVSVLDLITSTRIGVLRPFTNRSSLSPSSISLIVKEVFQNLNIYLEMDVVFLSLWSFSRNRWAWSMRTKSRITAFWKSIYVIGAVPALVKWNHHTAASRFIYDGTKAIFLLSSSTIRSFPIWKKSPNTVQK